MFQIPLLKPDTIKTAQKSPNTQKKSQNTRRKLPNSSYLVTSDPGSRGKKIYWFISRKSAFQISFILCQQSDETSIMFTKREQKRLTETTVKGRKLNWASRRVARCWWSCFWNIVNNTAICWTSLKSTPTIHHIRITWKSLSTSNFSTRVNPG